MYPRYSYSIGAVLGLARDALWMRHRSFAADARACLGRVQPEVRLLGAEHVPAGHPLVVTPNHYYRPGYGSQWTTLAISAGLPADVHWIMTGELTFPGAWYAPLTIPICRFALQRIARVYGFTTMPPMPPRPQDREARAAAVRDVLRYAKRIQPAVIGLAPEGGDQPAGQLSMPPSGVGRFCLLLAEAGLWFLPVGVYECGGELIVNLGQAYDLSSGSGTGRRTRDRLAAGMVMQHIAELLPKDLRGEYC